MDRLKVLAISAGARDASAVAAFVAKFSVDTVYEYSEVNATRIFHQEHLSKHVVLVRNRSMLPLESSADARAELAFRALADAHRGDALFVLVDRCVLEDDRYITLHFMRIRLTISLAPRAPQHIVPIARTQRTMR